MARTSNDRAQGAPNNNETLEQYYEMGISVLWSIATVFTLPVEYLLRPFFGTRYFPPIITLLSSVMMMCLGLAGSLIGAVSGSFVGNLLGIRGGAQTHGFIGLGTLTFFFFVGNWIHGLRLWRRMLHPEKEWHSEFEGPPLPFFYLLPKGEQFWFTRIVYEPIFVMVASIILSHLRFLDGFAASYLLSVSVMLFAKNAISWYRGWLYIRKILDGIAGGQAVSRMIQGEGTEEDYGALHVARFPVTAPQEARREAMRRMAQDKAGSGLPPEVASLLSPLEAPEEVGNMAGAVKP